MIETPVHVSVLTSLRAVFHLNPGAGKSGA
jgi:hypothetical protein